MNPRSIFQNLLRARGYDKQYFQNLLYRMVWRGDCPQNRWATFDTTPWAHPFLAQEKIEQFREFNRKFLNWLDNRPDTAWSSMRFGFVGNIANNLYSRAVVLERHGMQIETFVHPDDHYLKSQPGWELFDGSCPEEVSSVEELAAHDITLPDAPGTHDCRAFPGSDEEQIVRPKWAQRMMFSRYSSYFRCRALCEELQKFDALYAVQAQYLAMFANKPYGVTQSGGDVWYECSRDDVLGRAQREALRRASFFSISNPWSLAFARRYGLSNLIYLPYLIDEDVYQPGPEKYRRQWASAVGGSFYVLSTSRLDFRVKGSKSAIRAFARLAAQYPEARLVLLGWGQDQDAAMSELQQLGIADKVLVLPVAGKRRLADYLRSAHCLLDQFVLGYYGATALEAIASGLPVVMRLEAAQYNALLESGAPPVLQADSEEQAAVHLLRLCADNRFLSEIAASSRTWFLRSHGRAIWAPRYAALLGAIAGGTRLSFSGSPLEQGLSSIEREYHAHQLTLAPMFPHYA